jgi:hypothetical protein
MVLALFFVGGMESLQPAHLYAKEPVTAVVAPATTTPAPLSQPRRLITRRSFCNGVFGAVLAATVLPDTVYDINAYANGREHLGNRVYFSMDNILKTLSAEEREFVATYAKLGDQLGIVRFYNIKLYGDYEQDTRDEWWLNFFRSSRDASEFMQGQCNSRGICRHKSLILAAILRHYAIDAVVETGHAGEEFKFRNIHAWVRVHLRSGGDLIADPTTNQLMTTDEYYGSSHVSLQSSVVYKITKVGISY